MMRNILTFSKGFKVNNLSSIQLIKFKLQNFMENYFKSSFMFYIYLSIFLFYTHFHYINKTKFLSKF
jgi:hypothetical protein